MQFGIVTPVLNGRTFFRACAASIRAAASEAPSLKVAHYVRESSRSTSSCRDFAGEYDCAYIQSEDNGLYDAIEAGLNQAANDGCEILGWLNADEQYLPGALAAAERVFESNPKIGLVFGDYLLLDPNGRILSARREIPARLLYLRNSTNYLLSCTVFFRRSVWTQFGGFNHSYRLVADKEFYLRLLKNGVHPALLTQYVGAYTATGQNASLDPGAVAEWTRLRHESGAFASQPLRLAVRSLRLFEKAIHGCFFPAFVKTALFTPDGTRHTVRALAGSTWRWK